MQKAEKRKRAMKIRNATIVVIILADILIFPWILLFPKFMIEDIIGAPERWLKFGMFNSIKMVIQDPLFRQLYLILQLGVLALIIGIGWNVNQIKKKNKIKDGVGGPEPVGDGQFGTARWQNTKEMDENIKVWNGEDPIKKGGIIFGMEKGQQEKEKIWIDTEDIHTLLIGATRSGKDRKILQPSIWELAKAEESMIIADPKGEMFISTEEFLRSEGYNVITLNFRDPLKGNKWNILDLVNKALDENDIGRATEYAWDIANTIGKTTPAGSTEPIWKNGSESTLAAITLIAAMESDFKFQRHITTAYYLLSEFGQPLDDGVIPLLEYIKGLPTRHPAKAAFATANMAPYKTRASFFTTVLSDLRLFSDEKIASMTSTQDHDFEKIGQDKTAVFLIIPDEKNTRNVLATLYVSQVYQALVNLSNKRGGRIPRRVNVLLNEFGNLPVFPDFPTMLTVGGGRGIRFTLAVQDLAQIKTSYKDSAQTIQGNCSNWIFLKTADTETAKVISEKTGSYTVSTENTGSSTQSKSKGYSISHGEATTGRKLLMLDEVLRWDVGESLILPTGNFPARYPLPDLSMWKANDDFGFVKPTGDIDADRESNRKIIEKRWELIKDKELEKVDIWLPEVIQETEEDSNKKVNEPKEKEKEKVNNVEVTSIDNILGQAAKNMVTNMPEEEEEEDFL